MTPITRNLTVYKGITFTFFFFLRDSLSAIDTFTSDADTNLITTATTHGLAAGDPIQFATDNGTLPAPIERSRDYFVLTTPSTSTFTFSPDYGGLEFDIQAVGTGTNSVYTKRPIDLTGWTIWAYVKSTVAGALVLDLNPTVSSPTTGKVDLSMTDTETFALNPGNFFWDLILQNPTGERIGPLFSGSFNVIRPVTDPAL
jgi:hypothetical protein